VEQSRGGRELEIMKILDRYRERVEKIWQEHVRATTPPFAAVLEAADILNRTVDEKFLSKLKDHELAKLHYLVDDLDDKTNGAWRCRGCPGRREHYDAE